MSNNKRLMQESDIVTLSRKALEKNMDDSLAESHQAGFDQGLQAGVQSIIVTMLQQGCHPHFLAKITNLPVIHIQAINDAH